MGAEEAEERTQLMFHDERVTVAAAGGRGDDGLARQSLRLDEVEEVLEEPGVGTLVDRAADDKAIRGLDRPDDRCGPRAERCAAEGADLLADIDEVEHFKVDAAPGAHLGSNGLDQKPRAGRAMCVAAHGDDAQPAHREPPSWPTPRTGCAVRCGAELSVRGDQPWRPAAGERAGARDPVRVEAAELGIKAPSAGAAPTFGMNFQGVVKAACARASATTAGSHEET